MNYRNTLAGVLAASALLVIVPAQAQQDFPSKPIRLVVDGAAGGVNDVWARRYGQRLNEALKQPVVVDNRPGASGTLAANEVAKAAADGYTLLYGGMNPLVIYPSAGGAVRFDPQKDFVPVALGTMGYPVLIVGSGFGAKNLQEAIARIARAPSDSALTCGTGGQASVNHFACAQFARAAKVQLRPVPYKGGSLAATDAAAGHVDVSVGFYGEIAGLTGSGRLTPLAVFAPNRFPAYPDVPTMAEAGFPGLELASFSAFYAPANTPPAVVGKLNALVLAAFERPEMTAWLKDAGGFYPVMSAAAFESFYHQQRAKWRKLSQENGIRIEE